MSEAAGARLGFTASAGIVPGTNPRTCLLRAILPFTQPRERDLLVADVVAPMPAEGDTSIKDISGPLAKHRIRLQRVSGAYLCKGGAPFHLFNRQECKLIVAVRLVNREGRAWTHFVAWDGRTIHDRPYSVEVAFRDCRNPKSSKVAFGKLFPRPEFARWQITGVFEVNADEWNYFDS